MSLKIAFIVLRMKSNSSVGMQIYSLSSSLFAVIAQTFLTMLCSLKAFTFIFFGELPQLTYFPQPEQMHDVLPLEFERYPPCITIISNIHSYSDLVRPIYQADLVFCKHSK